MKDSSCTAHLTHIQLNGIGGVCNVARSSHGWHEMALKSFSVGNLPHEVQIPGLWEFGWTLICTKNMKIDDTIPMEG